jgi:hypothetical protein
MRFAYDLWNFISALIGVTVAFIVYGVVLLGVPILVLCGLVWEFTGIFR